MPCTSGSRAERLQPRAQRGFVRVGGQPVDRDVHAGLRADPLEAAHVRLRGRVLPTIATTSRGAIPRARKRCARVATSSRSSAASARPSRIRAAIAGRFGRLAGAALRPR